MTDVVLRPVSSGYNLSIINDNFTKVQQKINDEVLHLTGGNNTMLQQLDMNNNKLINVSTDPNDPNSLVTIGIGDRRWYNVDGDTLTGPMNASGQRIVNLPAPVNATEPMRLADVIAIDSGNALQLKVDLANSVDISKGASLVGFKRRNPLLEASTVGGMLSTTSWNLWEFSGLVTDKPTSDPTTWDWAPAIQAGNDAIRAIFNVRGPGIQNVLEVPGGLYPIKSSVLISPFVKIRSNGQVVFATYVVGSAFRFAPSAGDYNLTTTISKQQWWKGSFLDGQVGGIVFKNMLGSRVGAVALEIGPATDSGALNPVSRYSCNDFAIENYGTAMKMNRFRHYLGTFHRLHLESNDESVVYGDPNLANVVDSGENFQFYSCVFSQSKIAFRWYTDGFDTHFTNCSFDFVGTCFHIQRLYKTITVTGGHMEGIGAERADDGIGGIINEASVSSADNGTRMSLIMQGVTILTKPQRLFRGSNKLAISVVGEWRRLTTANDIAARYLCDPSVIIKRFEVTQQGREAVPSSSINMIVNPVFSADPGGVGVVPVGYTTVGDFTTYEVDALDSPGIAGAKSIKITSSAAGYRRFTTAPILPCHPGDDILTSYLVKVFSPSQATTIIPELGATFYDASGTQIGATVSVPLRPRGDIGLVTNVWNYPLYNGRFVAPPGAVGYRPYYQLAGAVMVDSPVRMSDLFACVLN